jgi:hypothetical protein
MRAASEQAQNNGCDFWPEKSGYSCDIEIWNAIPIRNKRKIFTYLNITNK